MGGGNRHSLISAFASFFRTTSFSKKHISDIKHKSNVAKLTKNLNDPYNVVQKIEKCYNKKMIPLQEIYTKQDLEQLEKVKEFEKSIQRKDNYFCYKNYKLPVNLFESSVFYYKHGIDTLKNKNTIQNKAIIDVGCHIADSVIVFRAEFANNPIYSFEPSKTNYNVALQTLKLNNIQGARIENLGLGDKECELKIHSTDNILKSCENTISQNGNEIVKITTLDKYVEKNNIKVGLIKVDIEGFEQNFLKGAKKTIISQRPILLISIYHNYDDFYNIKPMIESWNLGYKFSLFQGVQNSGKIEVETLLVCECM